MKKSPGTTAIVYALVVTMVGILTLISVADAAADTQSGLAYLKARQTDQGGFAEPGAAADVPTTCWALIGVVAAGGDPLSWKAAAVSPMEYLESQAASLRDLAEIETCALALAESGGDAHDLAGRDLVSIIKAQKQQDGRIGRNVEETCWGMIALAAAGEDPGAQTVDWLLNKQREDGGWGESEGVVVTDTALAVQALAAAGKASGGVVGPAMRMLRSRMGQDGGYSEGGDTSNTVVTSMVAAAIIAAGEDPSTGEWVFQGSSPMDYLKSMQSPDGHFQYAKGKDSQPTVITGMALPALAGQALPLGSQADPSSQNKTMTDTGIVGAGITSGSGPAVPDTDVGKNNASMRSASQASVLPTASGIWMFLLLCAAYVVVLAAAAIAAAALYVPAKPAARQAGSGNRDQA